MGKPKQIELGMEEKALLQDALQRTRVAMEKLEDMRSPRTESVVNMREAWGTSLIGTYTYLLSLSELPSWCVPSSVPQAASFERAVKYIQELYEDENK